MILSLPDVDTFVRTGGPAVGSPPVLWLHGNPDSADMWLPVQRHLELQLDSQSFIAPDLPGFGRSKASKEYVRRLSADPLETGPLDVMVEWLDALLEELYPDGPVHLVVHDFGGPYGLAWATRHPDRVASICAVDTIFFSEYRWHFWARVWRAWGLGELSMIGFTESIFRWEMRRGSPSLSDEQLAETWRFVTLQMKRMVLDLYRATDPEVFEGWEDDLRRLMGSVPSLALWGADDPYIAPEWAYRLGARHVEIWDGVGHWLPVEAPERLARRLESLWAESLGAESFGAESLGAEGAPSPY